MYEEMKNLLKIYCKPFDTFNYTVNILLEGSSSPILAFSRQSVYEDKVLFITNKGVFSEKDVLLVTPTLKLQVSLTKEFKSLVENEGIISTLYYSSEKLKKIKEGIYKNHIINDIQKLAYNVNSVENSTIPTDIDRVLQVIERYNLKEMFNSVTFSQLKSKYPENVFGECTPNFLSNSSFEKYLYEALTYDLANLPEYNLDCYALTIKKVISHLDKVIDICNASLTEIFENN